MRWMLIVISGLVFLPAAGAQAGESGKQPAMYDRLQAGQEAYRLHEEQRRYRIGRQVWLNDEMVFWSTSFPSYRYFVEPWPFLPGDIYGYPLAEPQINQPIGQRERKIGPNRWLSQPVYAEQVVKPEVVRAKVASGPREF